MWIYDYKSPEDNPIKSGDFIQIHNMSYVDNLPNWTYVWHSHDTPEFVLIINGNGTIMLDGQELPVHKGDIVLIPPKSMHHFVTADKAPMYYYTLRFSGSLENELYQFFLQGSVRISSARNYLEYMQNSFRILFDIHQISGGKANADFQTVSLSLLRLARMLIVNECMAVQLDADHALGDILYYIQENSGSHLTLDSLAKAFNMSPSHLSRLFCKYYQVSPINYLIGARIGQSTEYLLKSNLPIARIAELVGYDNPAHYTAMFQKRIGCTPAEYREKNQRLPSLDNLAK